MDNDESFEEEFDEYYEDKEQSVLDMNDQIENNKDASDASTTADAMTDVKCNGGINQTDKEEIKVCSDDGNDNMLDID